MNAVFFLGKRQLENYSIPRIKHRENYRLIAIVFESELSLLPSELRLRFDAVEALPNKIEGMLAEFDEKDVLRLIHKYEKEHSPQKISLLCQDEGNVLVAAAVRSALKLKTGPKLPELLVFRDKPSMKKVLQSQGVRTPRYLHFDKKYTYQELQEILGAPLIAKPFSGAASSGVYKISTAQEYECFLNDQSSHLDNYEIEEFIQGDLFHCDVVIAHKKIKFLECGKCSVPNLDLQKGRSLGSITLDHKDVLFQRVAAFTEQCLRAFGMPEGCFHTEIFLSHKNELVFLETGARAPGFIVTKLYENMTGINMIDLDFQIQSGVELTPFQKELAPGFFMVFPLQEGVVKELIPPKLESPYEIQWLVHVGQTTKACASNLDIGAILISSNPDQAIVERDFLKCSHHKAIQY